MGGINSEDPTTPEIEAKISQITDQTKALLEPTAEERKKPEYEVQALALMSKLETSRAELGDFCATIGEGNDRAVLFLSPLSRSSEEKMALTPPGNMDQSTTGTYHSIHEEYLYVNRGGTFKLAFRTAQDATVNADAPQLNDPEGTKRWATEQGEHVRHKAQEIRHALRQVIRDGAFRHFPDSRYPPEKGEGEHVARLKFNISHALDPKSHFPALRGVDQKSDAVNSLHQFRFDVGAVMVTKPDFVEEAIRASVIDASKRAHPTIV